MLLKKFFVLIALSVSVSFSQIIDNPKNDFKNFIKLGGDVFAAPVHFEKKDLLRTISVISVTSTSFLIDNEIKGFALNNQGSVGNTLFKIDDIYHIEFMAASIAAIYIYGISSKDTDVRNLGLRLAEGTVYSGTITLLGKFAFGRGRPSKYEDNTSFCPFSIKWEQMSLPSGHTALSFAYSTIMASAYNNFLWKFSWFSLAALVGAARIYNTEHWFSDVLLGGAIGYFVGEFVNNHNTNKKDGALSPIINSSQGYSIFFSFAF